MGEHAAELNQVPKPSMPQEVSEQPHLPLASTPVATALPTGWKRTFRALRHRNFRLFVTGQVISLVGTWMQNLAQSWLVYRLTHSEFLLGATGFCSYLPVLVLGPVAGIAADRYSRYRIVILTQTVFTIQALALAALTLSGMVTVTQVLVLATLWGAINAFDIPARQSLYIHMVGKEDLLNAISLNSVIFNSARVIGPSIAGILVAELGEGVCFVINAATFVAVIVSLLFIRLPETARARPDSPWAHLRDGFRYAHRTRPVRALLGMTGAVNISGAPAVVLAPFFADAIFHRGSLGLGFLTGAMGIGAVAGTLGLARRTRASGLPQIVFYSAVLMGACLVVFAWSPFFSLSMAMFALLGFSVMRQNASANTLIQTLIPDEYRGRIMALYSMTVVGMLPVGSLAAGAFAERFGPRLTVLLGGLLCIGSAAFFRRSLPELHQCALQRDYS
jgi:MFS family permease